MTRFKKILSITLLCVIIPLVIIGGITVFGSKSHSYIALCVSVISLIPFFISIEYRSKDARRIVLLSVMIALSVLSRYAFAFAPSIKPVSAMVIITGMYLGAESGFICGAFSAFISNFIFGQGPWTPFQMLAWGIIGFIAALLAKLLKKHFWALLIYGGLSGVFFSLIMDIWMVIFYDGYFNFPRYFTVIAGSLSATVAYVISNVVFLFVLAKPICILFERIDRKYGI